VPARVLVWLGVGLLGWVGTVRGADTGVLPYRAIADVFDGFGKVRVRDKLQLAVRVLPARGFVPQTNIALEIQSRTGPIPLRLSPEGEIRDFPLTPELRGENPRVLSNQPKGKLSLQAELRLRYSGKRTENVAWYADALGQANAAVRDQAGLLSLVSPTLKTVVFHFDPAGAATGNTPATVTVTVTVTARGERSEKTLRADPEGRVRLELSDALRRGGTLVFSADPQWITAE